MTDAKMKWIATIVAQTQLLQTKVRQTLNSLENVKPIAQNTEMIH